MTLTKYLLLIGTLIVIIIGGYFTYAKYNQYLPSTDIVHAKSLDQTAINQIRTTTPINEGPPPI